MPKRLQPFHLVVVPNPNPDFASVDDALRAAAPLLAQLYVIGERICNEQSQSTPELQSVPEWVANGR